MFSDRTLNWTRYVRRPAVIGILLVLAACGDESSKMTPPGEAPQTGAVGELPVPVLANSAWQLLRIDGEAVLEDAVPSLTFDAESRVAGSSGCNRFFGAFSVEGESLSFGPLGSTMMACPDALMRQERRLFEALEAVARMAGGKDGELTLLDSAGVERVLLRRQPAVADSGEELQQDRGGDEWQRFDCAGLGTVSLRFLDPDTLDLQIADARYALQLQRAASGARYTGDGVEFWNKGEEARLTLDGAVYVCRRVAASG